MGYQPTKESLQINKLFEFDRESSSQYDKYRRKMTIRAHRQERQSLDQLNKYKSQISTKSRKFMPLKASLHAASQHPVEILMPFI